MSEITPPTPSDEGEEWEVEDPYCGMRLRRSEAAATYVHRGETYFFCIRDHREAFARDPSRYLTSAEEEVLADAGREVFDAEADTGVAGNTP